MAKAFNDFIVRLVVAFLLVMLGVSTAQCAASPRAVGGTAYSLKGPTKAQLGHTAPLNANAASPVTAYVIPGQTTLLEYYTEYDPSPTCYEVSPGAWTVNTPPQHGAVSFRQVGGPLPNGDCASQNFTFAAIYYTLTDSSAVSDSFTATWATPDHLFSYQFTFSIGVFNVDLAKNNGNCGCVGGVAEGEPINGATGNLFEAQIDYVGGPDTHLALQRYYNSQAGAASSTFGANWTSSYTSSVSVNGSTAKVTRPDGRVETFIYNGTGWIGDSDVVDQLSGTASGGVQLTTSEDSVETYSVSGLLLSIATRAGLVTTLSYNASNQLTKVINHLAILAELHLWRWQWPGQPDDYAGRRGLRLCL